MIESRYKIEYVLPDEDVKKTSSFKVLWYLLLIPLVFMIVTGITYDFSYKDIASDASEVVEKAKVTIFNLGEIQKNKKIETKRNIVKATEIISKESRTKSTVVTNDVSKDVIKEKLIVKEASNSEPLINQDKITELTTKQELQLKTLQAQVAKNSELSQNLNQLSEKLLLEQLKTQDLNSQLVKQGIDRKELEEQLNKALEKTTDNEISLETLKNQETKSVAPVQKTIITTIETPEKSVSPKIVKETITDETTLADIPEPPPIVITEEVIVVKTDTDKIIEAMENSAKEKNKSSKILPKQITDSESINNSDSITQNDEISTKQEATEIEEKVNLVETKNTQAVTNDDVLSNNDNQTPKPEVEISKIEKDTDLEIKNDTEVKNEIVEENVSEEQEEAEKVTKTKAQPSGASSAVDDIIAAMEASPSNSTLETNQEVDPNLEREIQQQLVEKGNLSIDN